MGIDPNNRKLHQSFPHPQPQPVSGGSSSSGSMNKENNKDKPFDAKFRVSDHIDLSC